MIATATLPATEEAPKIIKNKDVYKAQLQRAANFENIETKIERITPAMAQHWIQNLAPNRHLSEDTVTNYAVMMERGEWVLNGEAFQIDEHGALINGQHRAHAIVLSGVTIPALVVRGLPRESSESMDQGRRRTIGDKLAMKGHERSRLLGQVVGVLATYNRLGTMKRSSVQRNSSRDDRITQAELIRFATEQEDALDEACEIISKMYFPRISRGVLGACYVLFARIDGDHAGEFIQQLNSGIGMDDERSAIYRLRQRFIKAGGDGVNMPWDDVGALTIKAWNLWRKGQTIQQLSWHKGAGEPFPTPE